MAREQAVVDVDDATGGIDAVIGVVRHHAVPDHGLARCHAQTDYPVPLEAHVVENGISRPRGLDATAEIAADGGVSHEHRAPDAMRGLHAIAREPVDAAVLHGKGSALKESDAVEPGAGAVDVEPAQHDMDAGVLMKMPLVPAASTLPRLPWLTMAIDLVMVTAPKPPGSRTLISPPAAVFEMAPANVLHGAVRLQGLASSPTPDTQVRVAWADASVAETRRRPMPMVTIRRVRMKLTSGERG